MSAFFAHNEFELGWDRETGKPGIALVSNAIQFWSDQRGEPVSVADIANAFNMAEEDVQLALDWPATLVDSQSEGG